VTLNQAFSLKARAPAVESLEGLLRERPRLLDPVELNQTRDRIPSLLSDASCTLLP
jgi:hypothetical protein